MAHQSVVTSSGQQSLAQPREWIYRETRPYELTSSLVIPNQRFQQLVNDLVRSFPPKSLGNIEPGEVTFTTEALDCLQEASEEYLIGLFNDANSQARYAKRVTIMPQGIHSGRRKRREIQQEQRDQMRLDVGNNPAAEVYLIQLFEDACIQALQAKRVTINENDMRSALNIRRENPIRDASNQRVANEAPTGDDFSDYCCHVC